MRIDYSTKLRVQLGMSEEESKNTSVLEYAIFVGIQQLYPDINKKGFGTTLYILLPKTSN